MKMTGNTILVTGGSSGIGQGLALALHDLGNEVIICGRRRDALERAVNENPGLKYEVLDVADASAIDTFAERIRKAYPALNVLINNAGIMRFEDVLGEQNDISGMEQTVLTNLIGPMRLTSALLKHLQGQPHAAIMNVSSSLGFTPLAMAPTYSATKAAMHSYTECLRIQLSNTNIEVIEIIPPAVVTNLVPGMETVYGVLPLDEFIAESIDLLKAQNSEICVEQARLYRHAAERGEYDEIMRQINQNPGA